MQSRRYMTPEQAAELGKLDPDAIARVREEAWPQPLNADELHDALVLLGFVTAAEGAAWAPLFERLRADGRATAVELPKAGTVWVAAERLPEVDVAFPGAVAAERLVVIGGAVEDRDTALRELVRSRFEALGPVTAEALAQPFGLAAGDVLPALAALEQQGTAMRGNFTSAQDGAPGEEWCERRLLARIHRYTLKRLRNEIEPATLADYPALPVPLAGPRRRAAPGPRGALSAVLGELQGLALPAALWEREVLPARIADYGAPLLDQLCIGRRGRLVAAAAERRAARARARRRSRRRRSRSCRARRCRCGGRSARSSPCKACRAPRSASCKRCASAARCSSSRSCKRAACCACKSRRRSASSSRAAS